MPGINVGIDLGTSNITVFVSGKGIVMSEATAISLDAYTGEVIAVGNSAMEMLGKAPDTIKVAMPVKAGMIADFSVMKQILSVVIKKVCKNKIFRPNIIISTPSSITALQKRTIIDVACACGAGKVCLIDEPVASALGSGIDIDYPHGVMVIDIGAGTCDIAVITMGTVAYSTSIDVAGDNVDETIIRYIKKEKDIIIGKLTAEKIKKQVGCVIDRDEEIEMSVNGKQALTQMPVTFTVTSTEICKAISETVDLIFDGIVSVLEQTPPELYRDICSEGITLSGGMSHLYGLDKKLSEKLKIEVRACADGEHSAAKGAGYALKNIDNLEDNGYIFRIRERYVD